VRISKARARLQRAVTGARFEDDQRFFSQACFMYRASGVGAAMGTRCCKQSFLNEVGSGLTFLNGRTFQRSSVHPLYKAVRDGCVLWGWVDDDRRGSVLDLRALPEVS